MASDRAAHGVSCTWRKLHLVLDVDSGEIVSHRLTDQDTPCLDGFWMSITYSNSMTFGHAQHSKRSVSGGCRTEGDERRQTTTPWRFVCSETLLFKNAQRVTASREGTVGLENRAAAKNRTNGQMRRQKDALRTRPREEYQCAQEIANGRARTVAPSIARFSGAQSAGARFVWLLDWQR